MKTTELKSYVKSAEGSPLRKTVMTLLERDLKNIKKQRVLEVGCGSWDFAKKILEKNGCSWWGVEPVDMGEKNLSIIRGSVSNMPYHGNSFDLVLGTQTMEHWFEYGVSLKKGLGEIHRVLKPKGVAMINVPIYNHGDPRFLEGSIKKIKRAFDKNKWDIALFERAIPIEKVKGWKKVAAKGFFSKVGYPDMLIPKHKDKYSHILNIHAVKKGTTKTKVVVDKLRPIKVLIRFILTYLRTRL